MLEQAYLNIISGRSRNPISAAARGILGAAELPYRALMQRRNRRYDAEPMRSCDLGRPTISVGNITAGGTGKTPVVHWLASQLRRSGEQPAILMRGYRKGSSAGSDEQAMLQSLLPGMVVEANPDRVGGAKTILATDPQTTCFVLDDGFQHRRARRQFDLVLINAMEPFGFGHVHPRGLLREPLCGLGRASAVLMTHASEASAERLLGIQDDLHRYSSAPVFHCDHLNDEVLASDGIQRRPIEFLRSTPFLLFSGIGQPESLVARMQQFGPTFKGNRTFGDHHHYTLDEMRSLQAAGKDAGAQILVTTGKDWVKIAPLLKGIADAPAIYHLGLRIRFWDGEESSLLKLVAGVLRKPAGVAR